jgi:hypothetical protein
VAGLTSGTSTSLNYIWFNNGTGDMKNCLDGQIYDSVLGANQAGRSDLGIIGYMDADQPTPATNYVRIKFDGIDANRQAVRNGWYDYYTMINIYTNPNYFNNYPIGVGNLGNLLTFIQDPANVPIGSVFTGVNESGFWAAKGELRFIKPSDIAYPIHKSSVANTIPGTQQP